MKPVMVPANLTVVPLVITAAVKALVMRIGVILVQVTVHATMFAVVLLVTAARIAMAAIVVVSISATCRDDHHSGCEQ